MPPWGVGAGAGASAGALARGGGRSAGGGEVVAGGLEVQHRVLAAAGEEGFLAAPCLTEAGAAEDGGGGRVIDGGVGFQAVEVEVGERPAGEP